MRERYPVKYILLQKEEPGWSQMLHQEGLLYNIQKVYEIEPEKISVLILNDTNTTLGELKLVKEFLSGGGCAVTYFENIEKIDKGFKYEKQKIDFISPEEQRSDIFTGVGRIDLFRSGYVSKKARYGLINNVYPAIYEKKMGKGILVGLPFDVNQALVEHRMAIKEIAQHDGKPISEEVSLVSKASVIRLVVNLIKKLHFDKDLPYRHLSYYPKSYKSAFAFRVDSDGYEEKSFKITRSLARKHKVSLSWFIDVQSMRTELDVLRELQDEGQDIQIHCYRHKIYKSYWLNYLNIKKARRLLQKKEIYSKGFSAPFGTWNYELNKALDKLGFQYSSEFGLSYDGFPFYPRSNRRNHSSRVLQIPIHSVCIGILLEANMTVEEMITYFRKTIDQKIARREPIFLYGHPIRRIGKFPEVIDFIFDYVRAKDEIWLTNFTEFNLWWRDRLATLDKIRNGDYLDTSDSSNIYTIRTLERDGTERFTEINS